MFQRPSDVFHDIVGQQPQLVLPLQSFKNFLHLRKERIGGGYALQMGLENEFGGSPIGLAAHQFDQLRIFGLKQSSSVCLKAFPWMATFFDQYAHNLARFFCKGQILGRRLAQVIQFDHFLHRPEFAVRPEYLRVDQRISEIEEDGFCCFHVIHSAVNYK